MIYFSGASWEAENAQGLVNHKSFFIFILHYSFRPVLRDNYFILLEETLGDFHGFFVLLDKILHSGTRDQFIVSSIWEDMYQL